MVYERDDDGTIRKIGRTKQAYMPSTEHGKIMQERSDERIREIVRALDERERQIVREILNEA